MVMQLLQSSSRIIDIYGHCAGTVIVEAMVEDLEDEILSSDGVLPPEGLNDIDDVKPQNNLTSSEKLFIALEMAECIAAMHGKF